MERSGRNGAQNGAHSATPKFIETLQNIGELRDALLVVTVGTYLLGYIVWTLTTWNLGLGFLSALDAQYFMAGAIPAGSLAFLVWFVINRRRIAVYGISVFGDGSTRFGKLPRHIVYSFAAHFIFFVALLSVFMAVVFVGDRPHFDWYWSEFSLLSIFDYYESTEKYIVDLARFLYIDSPEGHVYLWITSISIILVLPLVPFAIASPGEDIPAITLVMPVASFSIYVILMYISLFPNLPQEFGGIRGRCAMLDINTTELSRSTLRRLARPYYTGGGGVQFARRVMIIFSNDDGVVLEAESEIIFIDSSVVKAIVWCD